MDVSRGGRKGEGGIFWSWKERKKMWGVAYNVYVRAAEESTAKDNQKTGKKNKSG